MATVLSRAKSLRVPRISLRAAWHVWERNAMVYKQRWMYALLPNFFEPVFYLLGLGLGLGVYINEGGSFEGGYIPFIAPGLIAASAMNGASFETTYNIFVKLNFAKLYDAMVATKANMEDIAVGEILWAMTRSLIYGGAFLLITLFFDIPLSHRLWFVPLAIVLVGFCFASIGMAFSSLVRSIDLYTYYFTMFLTPSFLFSGIFFPVEERFPDFLVVVARATPLYNAVELIRNIVLGQLETIWLHTLYLLLVGFVLSSFAVWQMRRRVIS